ncbi:hypothetical protein [Lysinibacillus sp. RC79]
MKEYIDKFKELKEGARALGATTSKSSTRVANALKKIAKRTEEG